MSRAAVIAALVALCLGTGCSSARHAPVPSSSAPSSVAPSSSSAATVKPSGTPNGTPNKPAPSTKHKPVREVDGTCPYISTAALADKVGSRVGRTTVLTSSPKGCRFYLAFADFHAVAQITVKVYADDTTAHNAMIRSVRGSSETIGIPLLAADTEGILFRTKFYKPDGSRDWGCTFRKVRTVVTIKTDQNDTSFNAKEIAIAVSQKFPG